LDKSLTVSCAVLDKDGKIDINAYTHLRNHFAREPLPEQHPDPSKPGVRADEQVPKGLRLWDDVYAGKEGFDGAGWMAAHSSKREGSRTKWFNIQTCGSWRLAFILARLQRSIWEQGVAVRVIAQDKTRAAPKAAGRKQKEPVAAVPTVSKVQAEADAPVQPIVPVQAPQPASSGVPTAASLKMQQLRERIFSRENGTVTQAPAAKASAAASLLLAAATSPEPKRRLPDDIPDSAEKPMKLARAANISCRSSIEKAV